MRRREILVFVAAFAVVLVGGAALAQVGTFATGSESDAITLSAASSTDAAAETSVPAPSTTTPNRIAATPASAAAATPAAETTVAQPEGKEPEADIAKDEELPAPADTTPPQLQVLFPESEQHFEETHIAFEGTSEPGARVFAGKYEADVDDAGNWRIVLILSPGGNLVSFEAKDAAGNVTETSIKVFLDEDKEIETGFSAHQKWEVVDGSPAANVYYGTAQPGSKIWVGSKYGEGQTTVNPDGKWKFEVKFPTAPCNEKFSVVVEGEADGRSEFRMKHACATGGFSAKQKLGENTDRWDKFWGTGNPGSTVWVASEHGTVETKVEANGEWFAKLHFDDSLPANKAVKVVVESSDGDRAEFGFYWIVKESDTIKFSASQKFGSCGDAVPYDLFWGSASPGTTIWVGSPHGNATVTAGDGGGWEAKVEFPEAPVDEPFQVVVESSDGGRSEFTFVRTGDGDH